MILHGTFEEYIVGRLMEKLQLASHAIGDIEALLEAAGMNDQNEDGIPFEELIRQLVSKLLIEPFIERNKCSPVQVAGRQIFDRLETLLHTSVRKDTRRAPTG